MGFADARRADEQKVGGLTNELAGRQVIDLFARDGGIEVPVKVLQGPEVAEVGGLGPPSQEPFFAGVEFVLDDQFQELGVAESVGGGFLQTQAQGASQAGEPELPQDGV